MSETKAIAIRETQALAPQTPRGILTRELLEAAAEQRQLLGEFVAKQMVEGTDYGTIPGTEKRDKDGKPLPNRTLLKPGAEKLVDIFRCTPKFKLIERLENFEQDLFAYTFRVQLYQRDAEAVLAEGYGSANSREGRYRWRTAGRKCPNCGKESIIKGKAEFGGGWLCFAKKGGCGAKWKAGDQAIEGQEAGKVPNDDVATLANTILKMAKKRALVDGAIALARVSDLFTQDLEDIAAGEEEAKPAKKPTVAKPVLTDADAMVADCERGFTDWNRKKEWAETNKERKAALPEADQKRVSAAFMAAHPKTKPAEPPPPEDAEFTDDAKESA